APEGERAFEFPLTLGSTATLDRLLRRAQAGVCFVRHGPDLAVEVGRTREVMFDVREAGTDPWLAAASRGGRLLEVSLPPERDSSRGRIGERRGSADHARPHSRPELEELVEQSRGVVAGPQARVAHHPRD